MPSPPRTREFYRPLVEDLHEAARVWRGSLSRLHVGEVLLIAGLILAVPVVVISLVQYSESMRSQVTPVPEPVPSQPDTLTRFQRRGARFGRDAHGSITQVTLAGEHFTDRDLRDLSTIISLQSITLIDANVTDDGLRALRLPQLRNLELINTRVTEEAAESYPTMIGPPTVKVRLIQENGEE